MLKRNETIERLYAILKYILVILIFVITFLCVLCMRTDFPSHLSWLPGREYIIHPLRYFTKNAEPLWHWCVKLCYWIFRIPIIYSGVLVSGFLNVVVFEILCRFFSKTTKNFAYVISFVVMIVAPLYIPWFNPYIYLGQGSPNVWHNPTTLMVRPFAILVAIKAIEVMEKPFTFSDFKFKLKTLFYITVLTAFSAIAKPSFIQIFFPAIFVFCVVKCLVSKWKYLPNAFFLLVCCLPSLCVFILQFLLSFFQNNVIQNRSPNIAIKFLYAMKIWSPNPLISQILVIAFPLTVLVSKIIRKEKKSNFYIFTWLMYIVALFEAALLVEPSRPSHGNFCWGLILANMFVFISALPEYIAFYKHSYYADKDKRLTNISLNVCTFVLLCHVFMGIVWVCRIIFLGDYS